MQKIRLIMMFHFHATLFQGHLLKSIFFITANIERGSQYFHAGATSTHDKRPFFTFSNIEISLSFQFNHPFTFFKVHRECQFTPRVNPHFRSITQDHPVFPPFRNPHGTPLPAIPPLNYQRIQRVLTYRSSPAVRDITSQIFA